MKKVSVCIVTYNSELDIIACLEAVMRQTYKSIELIVVDNASSDSSFELVCQFSSDKSNVTVIKNDLNNGFAGGQNQAIAQSTGDYVVVLNPDVELEQHFIDYIVAQLEKDARVGSASGLLKLKSNPEHVDSTGLLMPFNRHALDRGMDCPVSDWLEPAFIFGPSGAAAVYKREMIEAIKISGEFFDEHFFAYKEDVDVAWRAQLLGWESIYVPEAIGLHARGWKKGGREHVSLFVRQHSYVNQLFMLVKNEQLSVTLLLRLPVIVFREFLKLIFILLKERDLLSSWRTIKRLLPIMLQKRKHIQQKIKDMKNVTFQNN